MRKSTIEKKKTNKFIRHHSDRYSRLKKSWRRPKGIDSCVRRKFKGKTKMPNIGYGNDRSMRGKSSTGKHVIRVYSCKDLEKVVMLNNKIDIEIARQVGKKKKLSLIELASKYDILIRNISRKIL